MSPTEDQITAWFAQQRSLSPERFPIGIGDDMAEIRLATGPSVLITTDMLLDGTHFDLRTATLEQAGYKAMATSLSDCAAMATVPVGAVVSVALPRGETETTLKRLHTGIVEAADKYDCPLVGGDVTCWRHDGALAVSVAMLSEPGPVPPVRRGGAQVGDAICVTGALGGSLVRKHLEFEPRVPEALKLTALVAVHAMMDISDGLSTDLNRICGQSGVGASIDAAAVPISKDAKAQGDPLKAAINDGEDFELLFTLAPDQCDTLGQAWDEAVPVTRIGRITESPGMRIVMPGGQTLALRPGGYEHLGNPT
jgi:thiamine-monophosphate kinase